MGMNQLLQALNYLPQIVEGLRKMNEEEKQDFVDKLALQGEERNNALRILDRFQKEKVLTKEEQEAAQGCF